MSNFDFIRLARPHLHPSQFQEFINDFCIVSKYAPLTIAFEKHISTELPLSDYAFYFRLTDFWKIGDDLSAGTSWVSRYVASIRKSRLGRLVLSNTGAIDGFWIEKDASKSLRMRQLAYAYVNQSFDVRLLFPNINLFTKSPLLSRLLNRYLASSHNLRQVGMVTGFGLTVGFKLVYKIDPCDVMTLPVPAESLKVIELYQSLFSSHHYLLHVSFLFGRIHSLSIELLSPQQARFSSVANWNQLLMRLGIDLSLDSLYGYKEIGDGYLLSGVSHLKVPIFKVRSTRYRTRDLKLYSGIILDSKA